MKTGGNTSTIIDVNKQRKRLNIEPVKCNCKTCLYFNGTSCKFNKNMINRKYCIKYEYSNPALLKKKKPVKSQQKQQEQSGIVIRKTTLAYLSEFFGIKISVSGFTDTYKNYSNGYGIKLKSREPLIIVVRNSRTKQKKYYQIIE